MENKNNQCFNIDESDELTKLKILNSALIKELRKYKEENTKLKHENEILNSIIQNLEDENKVLKSDGHRDHKCEHCGKSFPHSENLKQHKAICENSSLKSQVECVNEKERYHKCENL